MNYRVDPRMKKFHLGALILGLIIMALGIAVVPAMIGSGVLSLILSGLGGGMTGYAGMSLYLWSRDSRW